MMSINRMQLLATFVAWCRGDGKGPFLPPNEKAAHGGKDSPLKTLYRNLNAEVKSLSDEVSAMEQKLALARETLSLWAAHSEKCRQVVGQGRVERSTETTAIVARIERLGARKTAEVTDKLLSSNPSDHSQYSSK